MLDFYVTEGIAGLKESALAAGALDGDTSRPTVYLTAADAFVLAALLEDLVLGYPESAKEAAIDLLSTWGGKF